MAICSFAKWQPISGPVGPYVSGPFKIVHHTTEGSTATGAFAAFKKNRSDPHFTVDNTGIYQHIDTALCARALKNVSGGVETNKDSAIQIEVVGFAHIRKHQSTLKNVARLCRWIESIHNVSRVWPNGITKVATPSGKDPGGHNRNSSNWNNKSGHFGHSQVPENTHWDPAYSLEEINFLTGVDFDAAGNLLNEDIVNSTFSNVLTANDIDIDGAVSTMEEHGADEDNEFDKY